MSILICFFIWHLFHHLFGHHRIAHFQSSFPRNTLLALKAWEIPHHPSAIIYHDVNAPSLVLSVGIVRFYLYVGFTFLVSILEALFLFMGKCCVPLKWLVDHNRSWILVCSGLVDVSKHYNKYSYTFCMIFLIFLRWNLKAVVSQVF